MRLGNKCIVLCVLATVSACLSLVGSSKAAEVEEHAVPIATIYPGDLIADDMIETRKIVMGRGQSSRAYAPKSRLVGKTARRTLLPGKPVLEGSIGEPPSVIQGNPSLMVFETGGLRISGTGVPMQNAAVGELVSVRNSDTGVIVRGRVLPGNAIRVDEQ